MPAQLPHRTSRLDAVPCRKVIRHVSKLITQGHGWRSRQQCFALFHKNGTPHHCPPFPSSVFVQQGSLRMLTTAPVDGHGFPHPPPVTAVSRTLLDRHLASSSAATTKHTCEEKRSHDECALCSFGGRPQPADELVHPDHAGGVHRPPRHHAASGQRRILWPPVQGQHCEGAIAAHPWLASSQSPRL